MNDCIGESDAVPLRCWCWTSHDTLQQAERCSQRVWIFLSVAYLAALMPYIALRQQIMPFAVPSLSGADAILYLLFLVICVPAFTLVITLIANSCCERLLLDGRIAIALSIFRCTKWLDSGLRSTMADRARFLVLMADVHCEQESFSVAENLLREALRMPEQLSNHCELVFGKSKSGREVDRALFLDSIAVASVDLALICSRKGAFVEARILCINAISELHKYRLLTVQQMAPAEPKAKVNAARHQRWLSLCKRVSPSRRLAAIDRCLNDAIELQESLQQVIGV